MQHREEQQRLLRRLPKIDAMLAALAGEGPLRLVRRIVREEVAACREEILAGRATAGDVGEEALLHRCRQRLGQWRVPRFRPLINATGVIVHTNLGRSVLPAGAMRAILAAGEAYSNLEFDLESGRRGSRYSLVEELVCELTGAEAALVVNNNAAAVLLVLETLAAGREVIVSRGQLVEIGGSFRIPEVMAKSGAILREVGATNRTHLRDYEAAICEQTAMLLKVHTSNYRVIGFTAEVPLADLVALGQRHGLPVMEDLGSGCLFDVRPYGLAGEPTVQEVVAAGADVVTFSGDKLLGGPQAGIIVGRRRYVERIKRNPLNRALRIDKFTLAGLEQVFRLYLDSTVAVQEIPTLAMIAQPAAACRRRADRLVRRLRRPLAGHCRVDRVEVEARVGGGSLPEQSLASWAVRLRPSRLAVNAVEERLRRLPQPVVGRIEDQALLLDMRTVFDRQVRPLADALLAVFLGDAPGTGRPADD